MAATKVNSTVTEILSWPKSGKGIGFARFQELLQPLLASDWWRCFTTIRITGTNGKGSVTSMVHSILCALGVDAGRFISPHLIRFNERIQMGDKEISDEAIERAYSWVKEQLTKVRNTLPTEEFGSFELITAVCLRSFFEASVRVGVIEAGIGGRYDTTRLLPGQLIALTSVSLEHQELLGTTEELIAYDKLDLCPDGGTVVSVRRDPELWRRISSYCRLRRITLYDALEHCTVECLGAELTRSPLGTRIRIGFDETRFDAFVPLLGQHQVENTAIAISLVRLWTGSFMTKLSSTELATGIIEGLQRVRWPGRFACISSAPLVFIDVGHSPDACTRLAEAVKSFLSDKRIILVTGVSADKAVREILEILAPLGHTIICTRAHHKGEQVDRIAHCVRQIAPRTEVVEAATIEDAVRISRRMAESSDMAILVAGGLFLATEYQVAWHGGDPTELVFY